MAKSRTILVSGGGIAGLTSALCLAKRGFRVDVFEKAKKIDPIGAGIQISPNALRVLDGLDLGRQIRRLATSPQGIKVLSAQSNKRITTIPLGTSGIARFGMPYLTIYRADLQQILSSACSNDPDIRLHMGSALTDITTHPNGISALVLSSNGIITRRGQVAINAEGIWSSTRTNSMGLPPATNSGLLAWRGMIPTERISSKWDMEFTHLILSNHAHCVLYPVRNGQYVNAVLITKSKDSKNKTKKNVKTDELKPIIKSWNKDILQMLDLTDKWSCWPIYHSPISDNWSHENIVAIGDAAHGMLPFAAQGAAMAIEDGEVLAECIANEGTTDKALQKFCSTRYERVSDVMKLSAANGRIYHLPWPLSFARNLTMKMKSGESLLERQAWIYDWKPPFMDF